MHVHDGVHVYIAYDIDAKLRTTWLTSATDHIRANSIVILLKSGVQSDYSHFALQYHK